MFDLNPVSMALRLHGISNVEKHFNIVIRKQHEGNAFAP